MAAIGDAWAENAWIEASWVTGAWQAGVAAVQVHPPGMGRYALPRKILEEDEILLAVIMAFLHIKDD